MNRPLTKSFKCAQEPHHLPKECHPTTVRHKGSPRCICWCGYQGSKSYKSVTTAAGALANLLCLWSTRQGPYQLPVLTRLGGLSVNHRGLPNYRSASDHRVSSLRQCRPCTGADQTPAILLPLVQAHLTGEGCTGDAAGSAKIPGTLSACVLVMTSAAP